MKTKISIEEYTTDLANRYVSYFDVYRNEQLGRTPLAFMALHKRRDEKYLMTKTIKVWGVENQQCIFVASRHSPITNEFLSQFEEDIREQMMQFLPQDSEHMSTIFLGVVVTDHGVSPKLIQEVQKYRRIKFMRFGFHGWAEFFLCIVDLEENKIYFNPKSKSLVEVLEKKLSSKGE